MRVSNLQTAYLVHPDNVEQAKSAIDVSVAVVARPDAYIQQADVEPIVIETDRGVHLRCYLAEHNNVRFVIVYGRFDRVRSPAKEIDFAKTQAALNMLGIRTLIGTFVVGAISQEDHAGTVVIPDDFIGLGGYSDESWKDRPEGFRNVEMFSPFCTEARRALTNQAHVIDEPVHTDGTYVCFHGWPRIETVAELKYYSHLGGKVIGQTLDPEATLARQFGMHYAALTVMMDDFRVRELFRSDYREGAATLSKNIVEGRWKTFELFLAALPDLASIGHVSCGCGQHVNVKRQASRNFYYRPPKFIVD